jgi:TonB family protein
MSLRFGIIFLTCCLFPALAGADEVEQGLKQQFEGKTLVLRHPLEGSSMEFDADGKVLKGGDEGPWTVYGGVLIDDVALSPEKLSFKGRRILFLFLNQQFTAMELKKRNPILEPPFPPSVELEIKLDRALDSADQAQTILGRVFALNNADLLDSIPDYWRDFLRDRLLYDPSAKPEAEFRWQPPPRTSVRKLAQNAGPDATSGHQDDDKLPLVFRAGSGVTAPRPTYTPEPKYSAAASYEKLQGVLVASVIIGTDGNIHSIRVIRPLGLGLDESARSMLQTWRFDPAKRDGKPVAVEMNIEVSFNLY